MQQLGPQWALFDEHVHPPHSAGFYPTPPESTDGGLEQSVFPSLLGLTQPPTPTTYDHSYPASPEEVVPPTQCGTVINAVDSGDHGERVLSVSTSFFPCAHPLESDITISSSDGVLFYLHSAKIAAVSPTILSSILHYSTTPGTALQDAGIIPMPLVAIVLTVIFHTIYGTSCAQYSPTIENIIEAVDMLPQLGVAPPTLVKPQTPLFTLLLSHAPLRPMDVYALAAHHGLAELAVRASSHLLAYPLETIDDATAERIGTFYLKKLFFLHMKRVTAVKEILMQPPAFHPVHRKCDLDNQKKVTRAWALGSTYLAWDMRPDLSTHRIQSVFEPLSEQLPCDDCKEMLRKRIREAVIRWASVQTTI